MTQQRSNDEVEAIRQRSQRLHATGTGNALAVAEDVRGLLARVSELEQENERKQTILDQDWFSLDDLMKERARAERAEANAREMESRWATALDLLSERTARLWVAEDALSAAALAGLSLQEGRDDA